MDLQKNRLAIGAVVLLGLLGVAVWQIRARQGEQEAITEAEPEGELPEIDKDEIDSLEITTPGEEGHTVRLAKVDNTWRVVAPLEAPADEATVRTALEKLRKDIKAEAGKRLNRIEGQVRGLGRMVEEDRYCIDIVTQIAATRAALRRLEEQILKDHVGHCVEHAIASGNKADQRRKIEELMAVVSRADR